ncbi:MAG: aspartyl-tRNA(Asn)/glutamyl-tRNA(Gln) amidotransferase subunit A [Reinekea sp.]|jgi:aspartyl-tRNA(Asn)/glutamyl-tRNA(Gln) amidotransferase subunit A
MRGSVASVDKTKGTTMQDWLWMTAADLGRGIGAGDIDPVDLTGTYLNAIDAHPLTHRIYTIVTHDRARSEAKASSLRAKSGQRRSPLDGVPVSWKDLIDSAGITTQAGTRLMDGRVPDTDADVLRAGTAAGLVCLGKTHLSEIAFSGLGYNPQMETPPCVNDVDAVPGGSSSGAAASVAFGLAAAAVGSDTGGSVRIPAAWNDLVGLKTTHGRITLKGVVPLCLTFDTIGPLCRSVEDAGLMLAALEGTKPADMTGMSLKGRRFAILDTIAMDELRDAPRDAFNAAVDRIKAAGGTVDHIEIPAINEAFAMAGPLFCADAYGWWKNRVEAAPEKMFPQILERVRAGRDVLAADYVAYWIKLREIRETYMQATAGFDAVICPTAPILPPNLERLNNDPDYYRVENLLSLRNTRVGNLMGLASLTIPTAVPSCGIMLNGPAGSEEKLLRLGVSLTTALT